MAELAWLWHVFVPQATAIVPQANAIVPQANAIVPIANNLQSLQFEGHHEGCDVLNSFDRWLRQAPH